MMNRNYRRCTRCRGAAYAATVIVLWISHWLAGPSLGEDNLRFGMSTALSGPAADLGVNMRDGMLAAFHSVNQAGGIGGYELELVVLDDGYEPARTAPNVHRLINEMNVLAIVGNVGTPTSISALPIIRRSSTPFFGAFTGASALRKLPPEPFVINYRASYAEETAAMVDALVQAGVKPEEIGFFTQNDSFGDDGFFGGLAAILKHQKHFTPSNIAHGRYTRNSSSVEAALADILMHDPLPKAVIMVGTYGPCAKLIALAKQNGYTPQFLGVSFVGSDALQKTLGVEADGVVITEVLPHFLGDTPLAASYRQAMQALDSRLPFSFGSFEGYTVATILIRALERIEGPISRQEIALALEGLNTFDIGLGTSLTLGPNDHQASSKVWPVVFTRGQAVALEWSDLATIGKHRFGATQ